MAKKQTNPKNTKNQKDKKENRFLLFWVWLKEAKNLPLIASITGGVATVVTGAVVVNALRSRNDVSSSEVEVSSEETSTSNSWSSSSGTVTYTVTFNSLGGTEVPSQTVVEGEFATFVASTKVGYDFNGWFRSQDEGATLGAQWIFETQPVTSDITLYASFTIKTLTITFISNGGTAVEPLTANYGTAIEEPSEPTRLGYTFAGWYEDEAFITPFVFDTMPDANMSLYAQWTLNQYILTFQTNGGSLISPLTVDYGAVITAPADPTRAGYTFQGWYEDEALTTVFTFTTMPATHLTLYAKWQQDPQALLASGRDYVLYLSKAGQLYAAGYLVGTTPVSLTMPTLNAGETIQQLYASFSRNYIVTSTNRIITWVHSNNVANPGYTVLAFTTHPLLTNEIIRSIHTNFNSDSAYFLTSENRVFVHGANSSGVFNNGSVGGIKSIPELLPLPTLGVGDKIISVANHGSKAFLITESGVVYAIGGNSSGQLGIGSTSSRESVFQSVSRSNLDLANNEKIIRITGGDSFTFFHTNLHRVFGSGGNGLYQLGLPATTSQVTSPMLITVSGLGVDEQLNQPSTSGEWGTLLSNQGNVYHAGFLNVAGYTNAAGFKKLDFTGLLLVNETVVDVQSGNGHIVALSNQGRVLGFGYNTNGQLAIGNTTHQTSPVLSAFGQ